MAFPFVVGTAYDSTGALAGTAGLGGTGAGTGVCVFKALVDVEAVGVGATVADVVEVAIEADSGGGTGSSRATGSSSPFFELSSLATSAGASMPKSSVP